jgi:XapX domain-containing protein
MKPYLVSLAVGLLVGVIYALFNVRSPAPPVIALVGLLGILAGEQIPPLVRQWLQRDTHQASWIEQKVRPHMFGQMPGCEKAQAQAQAHTQAHTQTKATETHDV